MGGINIVRPLSDASIVLESELFAVGDGKVLYHGVVLSETVGAVFSMVLSSLRLHDACSVRPLCHANRALFGTVDLDRRQAALFVDDIVGLSASLTDRVFRKERVIGQILPVRNPCFVLGRDSCGRPTHKSVR